MFIPSVDKLIRAQFAVPVQLVVSDGADKHFAARRLDCVEYFSGLDLDYKVPVMSVQSSRKCFRVQRSTAPSFGEKQAREEFLQQAITQTKGLDSVQMGLQVLEDYYGACLCETEFDLLSLPMLRVIVVCEGEDIVAQIAAKLHLDLSVALTHTCVLVIGESGEATLQNLRASVKISPAFPSVTTSLLFSEEFVCAAADPVADRTRISQFVSYNLGFGHIFRFYGGNHNALQKFSQQHVQFDAQCGEMGSSMLRISEPVPETTDSAQHLVPDLKAF